MDDKERLRLAKEALDSGSYDKETIEYIFPELKESDDERIRKAIKSIISYNVGGNKIYGFTKEEMIAWLEKQKTSDKALQYLKENHSSSEVSDFQAAMNIAVAKAYDKGYNDGLKKQGEHVNFLNKIQIGDKVTRNRDGVLVNLSQLNRVAKKDEKQGEQKPADKVEPKFHEGDWVVNNTTLNSCHIVKVEHGQYICDDCSFPITKENEYHLWTIQDAKDGDVLFYDSGWTCIFKHIHGIWYSSYCFITADGEFHTSYESHAVDASVNGNAHPATKEQRDLLFQKMKEAGYEWDAEKKELKKIEQKPAWSEEDREVINLLSKLVYEQDKINPQIPSYEKRKMMLSWLKSLKNRVQPYPKQEWNKKDKEMYKKVETAINSYYAPFSRDTEEMSEWFKNLKDRVQLKWKPSDRQMKALKEVCDELWEPDGLDPLYTLWEQLKKLKEE